MAEVENENYIVRQGSAGSLQVQLLSGDVLRAVKKMTKEAQMDLAKDIAGDAKRTAPRDTGDTAESITHGETRKGNAYIRADFPAAFVELGHRVANQHTGRLKKKKRGGGLRKKETEVKPYPFMRPALDKNLGKLKGKIESRKL